MTTYFDSERYAAAIDARDDKSAEDEGIPTRGNYSYDQVACDQRDYAQEWRSSKNF